MQQQMNPLIFGNDLWFAAHALIFNFKLKQETCLPAEAFKNRCALCIIMSQMENFKNVLDRFYQPNLFCP